MDSEPLQKLRAVAALGAAAAALILPAAASADAVIATSPIKVKDYTMTVSASDGKQDSLYLLFARTVGKALQMHTYSFATGVKVTVAKNLVSATVKGSLGRYGAVNLKLRGAGRWRSRAAEGCTGTAAKGRAGTLAGSFKPVADSLLQDHGAAAR